MDPSTDLSGSAQDQGNYNFSQIYLGQHDSTRVDPPSDLQYGHLLNLGVSIPAHSIPSNACLRVCQFTFVTAPITNDKFHSRILDLVRAHLESLPSPASAADTTVTPRYPEPVVPTITAEDTGLYPSNSTRGFTAYCSPWIDIASPNPVISSVSRQVLNLEVYYANFCGVRTVIVPGPRQDGTTDAGRDGLARYARAIKEALSIASRTNLVIDLPMYREPGLGEKVDTLTMSLGIMAAEEKDAQDAGGKGKEIDLFSSWDTWDQIRTVCEYNFRLQLSKFPSAARCCETRSSTQANEVALLMRLTLP